MSPSLRKEITCNYYQTTAIRGHQPDRRHYETAALGLLRRFRKWLPSDLNARCLDIGCGCGEMLYLLEKLGFEQTKGIDASEDQLEKGAEFVDGELICCDALDYLRNCQTESVDFVSAVNVLEHFEKDELMAVLRETRRILAPGGYLVAMVPNAISPFGSLTRHWDLTHEWAFTPNNFRQLSALTGFDGVVEFRECGPVPHGVVSGLRFALWQVLRVGIATWFLIELGTRKERVYSMDMLVRLRVPSR